jgi:hypothetical protein
VDLGAVRHNVVTLKRKAPNSRLMAVVKADARSWSSPISCPTGYRWPKLIAWP